MSVNLHMKLALIFLLVYSHLGRNYIKIGIGKCTPNCRGTMAVEPLQFYPQFDIQLILQKMLRKYVINRYIHVVTLFC